MRRSVLIVLSLLAAVACNQQRPISGPAVHCFNELGERVAPVFKQDVSTGKITVTCPTGQ